MTRYALIIPWAKTVDEEAAVAEKLRRDFGVTVISSCHAGISVLPPISKALKDYLDLSGITLKNMDSD